MIDAARLLQTFLALVRIDNPSGQEAQMAQAVLEQLRALGLNPEQDAKGNIIAAVPGKGEPLLISAHLDSVAPAVGKVPVVADGFVRSTGDTVLGSDDLAGVAAILEAVRSVLEAGEAHRAAELVFTVEEEVGLRGSRALDYRRLKAKLGVALDLNGDPGGICIAAPGQDRIEATIKGRAAHAGVAPEQGINAIRVAAEAIAAMPLGRIDEETTANIGVIGGGAATNIVPDRVELRAEARSRDVAKLDRQTEAMRVAFETAVARHGAELEWRVERAYGPVRLDGDAPIVTLCRRAMTAVGLQPRLIETGGGSDVNVFTMHGIAAVNLSIGYREIHSTAEHIAVADLEAAARVVRVLLTISANS